MANRAVTALPAAAVTAHLSPLWGIVCSCKQMVYPASYLFISVKKRNSGSWSQTLFLYSYRHIHTINKKRKAEMTKKKKIDQKRSEKKQSDNITYVFFHVVRIFSHLSIITHYLASHIADWGTFKRHHYAPIATSHNVCWRICLIVLKH